MKGYKSLFICRNYSRALLFSLDVSALIHVILYLAFCPVLVFQFFK